MASARVLTVSERRKKKLQLNRSSVTTNTIIPKRHKEQHKTRYRWRKKLFVSDTRMLYYKPAALKYRKKKKEKKVSWTWSQVFSLWSIKMIYFKNANDLTVQLRSWLEFYCFIDLQRSNKISADFKHKFSYPALLHIFFFFLLWLYRTFTDCHLYCCLSILLSIKYQLITLNNNV